MKAIRQFVKVCTFLSILVLSLLELEHLFILGPFTSEERISGDNRASFELLEPYSLDMVYVGASNVYAFWQAPLAWDRYGLASHTYTNSSMPGTAIRYAIQQCRKTQPNALYVVNINNFKNEGNTRIHHAHWTVDTFPRSIERLELIDALCKQNDFDFDDRLELYFPLMRFHSTWSQLKKDDFVKIRPDFGGGGTNAGLYHTENMTKQFDLRDERLSEIRSSDTGEFTVNRTALDDLIKYCKQENVSILFVNQPQAITNIDQLTQVELLIDVVEDAGMDIIDLSDPSTSNLIKTEDFKDALHTNIHGSIKYTDHLARYIMDTYEIPDRRDDEGYADWFEKSDRYKKFLMTHIVRGHEFDVPEYRSDLHTHGIEAKNLHLCTLVTWKPAAEADEYLVYRQKVTNIYNPYEVDDLEEYDWQCVAHLSPDTTSYVDTTVHDSYPMVSSTMLKRLDAAGEGLATVRYDYSVIPILKGETEDVYGSNYVGRASIEVQVQDD